MAKPTKPKVVSWKRFSFKLMNPEHNGPRKSRQKMQIIPGMEEDITTAPIDRDRILRRYYKCILMPINVVIQMNQVNLLKDIA